MALGRRVLWCVLVGILVVPWMDWGKEHREEYLGYRVSRKGGKKFKRLIRSWAVHGPNVGEGKKRGSKVFAAILDDLMGPERNELELDFSKRKQVWDADVDKYFLAGLSPYDVLRGTNKDAPVCLPGIEEWDKKSYPALRREFQSLPQVIRDAYGYEFDLWRLLKDICEKMDM
ncbi:hypothetical protein AAMO2058_001734900, partial [Amorphochlora amoebiformis]